MTSVYSHSLPLSIICNVNVVYILDLNCLALKAKILYVEGDAEFVLLLLIFSLNLRQFRDTSK